MLAYDAARGKQWEKGLVLSSRRGSISSRRGSTANKEEPAEESSKESKFKLEVEVNGDVKLEVVVHGSRRLLLPASSVVAVRSGGAGALLRAAADSGSLVLVDALLNEGVSPFEATAQVIAAPRVAFAAVQVHARASKRTPYAWAHAWAHA